MLSNKNNITIIDSDLSKSNYWKDLLKFRELFYYLAWRNFLVKYKQTLLGISWAIFRPLTTMLIFTIVFSLIARLPNNDIPYPILVLTALIPWQFFSNAFTEASNSLVNNASLVSKVYFPRIILPVSSIYVCLVDFAISFILLLALMAWYDIIPDERILYLPFFIVLTCCISFGAGIFFAALTVKYRDFQILVPFIVQIGLYISPVGYSSTIVPSDFLNMYSINPMVGIIEGFRWSLLGSDVPYNVPGIISSICFTLFICIIGYLYFRKTEKNFADVI